jgi:hydroxymethylglutaryl-CoA synthase
MATIVRYGAYVPKYRATLGEIQGFEGRPGRPRSKTLAIPALDEDPLTMAWEAASQAIASDITPTAVICVTQSAPTGLRKMSQTLVRALDRIADPEAVSCFDVTGHPGSLLDAFALAGALVDAGGGPVLVVATDYVVAYDDKVLDMLSAAGAAAFVIGTDGFATLGEQARDGREVFDVWRLGTEPTQRYRMEVLFDAYTAATRGAVKKLEATTGRDTSKYAKAAVSQPHPQTVRGLGRLGISEGALDGTVFVGDIGNLGVAALGVSLALALDGAGKGKAVLAVGYGAGEAIAQEITIDKTVPKCGVAAQLANTETVSLGTYYRWTRGRQQQPH